MNVEHVLADKGRHVATIEPSRTLAQAAHRLSEERIGALVVTEGDNIVRGILSERDIVRALAREGAAALDAPVSRHMTADVVTCTREAGMNELMQIMTHGKFRHVPVVENGVLLGIVSIGDVVKGRLADVEAEHQALREYIATA